MNQQAETLETENGLNRPVTLKFLLSFTIPTILSWVISGSFGIVDGVFASRGISVEALSAVNFIMPFLTLTMAISFMLSMGGCALVAKKKGEGRLQEARQNFTLLTLVTLVTSLMMAVGAWFGREPLLDILGVDAHVHDLAMEYLEPLIWLMPFVIVGLFKTQFLIAEGRPVLGMFVMVSGAAASTGLNALFILVFDMGVLGLSLATGIGYAIPAVLGLVYFSFNRKGTLYFVRPTWDVCAIGRSSLNGISEMVTMMATTVTTTVMNNVLVRIVGFEGVAAAGIVMGLQGVFSSLYIGYAAGVAPIVSYHYGQVIDGVSESRRSLRKLYKKSIAIVGVLAMIAVVATILSADLLVRIYVPAGTDLHTMTVRGLRIAAMGYLFMGFNMFATNWFTAFNDGLVSGFLSFARTLVLNLALLLTLPRIWDLTGVWVALPLMEVASIFLTVFFLLKMGKKYYYRERSEAALLPAIPLVEREPILSLPVIEPEPTPFVQSVPMQAEQPAKEPLRFRMVRQADSLADVVVRRVYRVKVRRLTLTK
ncbi:MAG: MATE family efflux transporter [Oscillospiraceae bacterium]|nr:MATE family efflux transporter [Oscillospiraceae bacterium]